MLSGDDYNYEESEDTWGLVPSLDSCHTWPTLSSTSALSLTFSRDKMGCLSTTSSPT